MEKCNKQQFSKRQAMEVLNYCKKNRAKQYRREERAYHCPECNSWHLTKRKAYNEKMY